MEAATQVLTVNQIAAGYGQSQVIPNLSFSAGASGLGVTKSNCQLRHPDRSLLITEIIGGCYACRS